MSLVLISEMSLVMINVFVQIGDIVKYFVNVINYYVNSHIMDATALKVIALPIIVLVISTLENVILFYAKIATKSGANVKINNYFKIFK